MNKWKEPPHEFRNNLATWVRLFAKHLPTRSIRHWLYRNFLVRRMGKFVRIGMDVEIRFPKNIEIGNNVQINDDVFIMNHGNVTLGDDVLIGPGVKILTVYHDCLTSISEREEDVPCWQKGKPRFVPVIIEHDVWIGTNVVILPGSHIGHHSVIGANSVVKGNINPFSLIGGNPPRLTKILNSSTVV